jgi:hypothetical protein
MRRSSLAGIVAFAVIALVLAHPPSVRAECPFYVVPPATDAARSAREVIVGTVIENVNETVFDFRLRIDHVLRGPARVGDVRRFKALFPNWPMEGPTADGKYFAPCEPIPGWKGNVIAMSLDALAPDGKTRYNGASWIKGRLPINRDLPRTTLAEMRALAAMPPTDTSSPSVAPSGTASDSAILAVVAALAFGLAMIALRLPRRPARP